MKNTYFLLAAIVFFVGSLQPVAMSIEKKK